MRLSGFAQGRKTGRTRKTKQFEDPLNAVLLERRLVSSVTVSASTSATAAQFQDAGDDDDSVEMTWVEPCACVMFSRGGSTCLNIAELSAEI